MPIFTAIGTAIAGALFAGSAIAASLIGGALAFGVQLGLSYLKRPKKRNYTAVQGETQFGGDVPVGTIYGRSKVKGQRVFYAKYGSGNKFNAEVFVLANGWCDGLDPYVYFYGRRYDLVARGIIGNEHAHYGIAGFGDAVSIRFYDGRPGQMADYKLVNDTGGLGQTWRVSSSGEGLCYVVVEREYNADLFPTGKPDFDFVLRGLREYDPRRDSTVSGGSGPQRYTDLSTWVWTENPAVHRLNYQLGLRARSSTRTLIGEGKTMGQLDLGTYFAAMNVCDSIRAGKPTYRCSLYVNGEDDHTEILKEFDDAMAGYGINRRGLSGVIPGAPQIPVMNITADDIPVDRPKDIQFRKSAFDRFNHLSGQFTSIEAMWNPESLTPVVVNLDITEDGRNKQATNDFLQVTDPDIAQYLLNIRYRQNRIGGTATIPVSRRVGLRVQEGEWVTWRGKTWLITEWSADEQFRFTLKLSETSPDIYDDGAILPGPIIIPPTPVINPSLLSTVGGFSVAAGLIGGPDGVEVPALEFIWEPPGDPSIVAVRFQYQIEGQQQIYEAQTADVEKGSYITTDKVIGGVIYNARATITTIPDRLKTYTPWVTTADPTAVFSIPVYLKSLNAEVLNVFKDIFSQFDDVRPLLYQLLTNFQHESVSHEIARRKLEVTVGSSSAFFEEQIAVIADGLSATATQLTTLGATVNDNSAQGLVKFAVAANQSGVDARFSVALRGSIEDEFKEAGFFLELVTVNGVQRSQFSVLADRFTVTDGGLYTLPFVYENGVLTLQNVRVQWADIQNAVINNLVVGTSNIEAGAVTAYQNGVGSNSTVGNTFVDVAVCTSQHGPTAPTNEILAAGALWVGAVEMYGDYRILSDQDGVLRARTVRSQGQGTISAVPFCEAVRHIPPAGRESTTYRLQVARTGPTVVGVGVTDGYIRALTMKR